MIPRRLSASLFALILLGLSPGPSAAPAQTADSQRLSEPARWLQQYLRIDTTLPPGRGHLAAAFLAGILHREGIATRLLVPPVSLNVTAGMAVSENKGLTVSPELAPALL